MRKALTVFSALALSLTLSSCGLGNAVPQTIEMGGVGNGVDAAAGAIAIQDTTLVYDGSSLGLVASLVNRSLDADSLEGIGVNGELLVLAQNDVPLTMGATVPARNTLRFGHESEFSATLVGDFTPGTYATVEYVLAAGGSVTKRVLIVEKTGFYSDVVTSLAPVPAVPVVE